MRSDDGLQDIVQWRLRGIHHSLISYSSKQEFTVAKSFFFHRWKARIRRDLFAVDALSGSSYFRSNVCSCIDRVFMLVVSAMPTLR